MQNTTIIIDHETIFQQGVDALAKSDPVLARLIVEGARPELRRMESGYSGLCRIVTGQQLSTASAAAIWKRVTGHFQTVTPLALRNTPDEVLRGLGLSAGKIRTLQAISEAVITKQLLLETLHLEPIAEAHRQMTTIHGIGPWTADIYLMFCIGHADIFPAADLALQEAVKIAYEMSTRPQAKMLLSYAEKWRPWRSIAAGILWTYYRQVKTREGISFSN